MHDTDVDAVEVEVLEDRLGVVDPDEAADEVGESAPDEDFDEFDEDDERDAE